MNRPETKKERLIAILDVIGRTGMKKTFIYVHMKNGSFPRSFRIKGSKSVRWLESEVDEWIQRQLNDTAA